MDGARNPGGRFRDKALEDGSRGGAELIAAFGMPLEAKDEVSVSTFCSLSAFYCFDDGVLRATGGDAEAVAGDADRLMVAGVDGKAEETLLQRGFFGGEDACQEGSGGYRRRMGDSHGLSGGVVYRHRSEMLYESAAAPYVEGLNAEADGEDRFIEVVGVLDKELINILTRRIGRGAFGNGVLPVLLRIYIGGTAGEEDGLAGIDKVGDLGGSGLEWNLNRFTTGFADGFGVVGPGPCVVVEVRAGGKRDGYSGFHGYYDDTANS